MLRHTYFSVICQEAPNPQHTVSNATAYHLHGAVVEYWCSEGYEATEGDFKRICEVADQQLIWAGRDLQCTLSHNNSKWIDSSLTAITPFI